MKSAALISVTALTAILAGGCNEHRVEGGRSVELRSNYSVEQARRFHGFDLYYAGAEVAGLPLTAVTRDPVTAPPGTAVARKLRHTSGLSSIDFLYGSCVVPEGSEGGCGLPLDIQVWPACARYPALYVGPLAPEPKPTRIRGVPAAYFEGGHRLEIQTGDATIVIFGGKRLIRKAVNALEGLNVRVPAGNELPPPVRGALDGSLACS